MLEKLSAPMKAKNAGITITGSVIAIVIILSPVIWDTKLIMLIEITIPMNLRINNSMKYSDMLTLRGKFSIPFIHAIGELIHANPLSLAIFRFAHPFQIAPQPAFSLYPYTKINLMLKT